MSNAATRTIYGLLGVLAVASGCSSPDGGPQVVGWTISWLPVTAHEDGTALEERPTYHVEMATEEQTEAWQPVWMGEETTATVYAPPGKRCFRAVTVENGVKSQASEPVCLTKFSDKGRIREARN